MKTNLFVLAFALILMAAGAHAEILGVEEWNWDQTEPILDVAFQGRCPNALGATGPFLQCSDNFVYTTPDHRFTLRVAWSGYSLAGPGGWDNVTITVTDNTGEAGTFGFNPVQYFTMLGPPKSLSAFGILFGECSAGVGKGAEVAYLLDINRGYTTPTDNIAKCPKLLSYSPPLLRRPWRQPSEFDPQLDFVFPPGSEPGSSETIHIIAAFSTDF